MRTTSALQRIDETEGPTVANPTDDTIDAEPHSVWERVATVATVLICFQFALLALIGL